MSGDIHAARLIEHLKAENPAALFVGMGGDNMRYASCRLVRHLSDMAFMGITAVLKNIRKIRQNFLIAKKQMLETNPTTLVLVDYPSFNLKMAAWCRKHLPETRIVYYIPPKVWAWKRWRVHKIGRLSDEILCIFPFEVDFYNQYGYKATYVGNPTMMELKEKGYLSVWQEERNTTQRPYIALLPGSRRHEIEKCLPRMIKAAICQKGYDIVVAAMNNIENQMYEKFIALGQGDETIAEKRISIVYDSTYEIVKNAAAAVVCSGTATLETALIGCPQTAVYHLDVGPLLYQLKPLVFKIPYFTLVNIIAGREIIKEWMAYQFTSQSVATDLSDILNNGVRRKKMLREYELLKENLDG